MPAHTEWYVIKITANSLPAGSISLRRTHIPRSHGPGAAKTHARISALAMRRLPVLSHDSESFKTD